MYGHHPFDWNIAATHLGDVYQGLNVPSSRPTLVIGSQLVAPSCHLTDIPSGSIVQIPIGALPMESSNDAWDPTPWVVPGPFFQYVPARGPAGEDAVSPALTTTPDLHLDALTTQEVACQTDPTSTVDAPLLSAQVVRDLALQLQGMAECLLSLPFSEHGERSQPSSSLSSSQPLAPVFCAAADATAELHPGVQAHAVAVGDNPDSSNTRQEAPFLGLCLLVLLDGGTGAHFWVGVLWFASSVDWASGSYFTPDAKRIRG